jgi:hypothetical protein
MGYVCEEMNAVEEVVLSAPEVNMILTAVVAGMAASEPPDSRLAATAALGNAIEFAEHNFANENERNYLMQVSADPSIDDVHSSWCKSRNFPTTTTAIHVWISVQDTVELLVEDRSAIGGRVWEEDSFVCCSSKSFMSRGGLQGSPSLPRGSLGAR